MEKKESYILHLGGDPGGQTFSRVHAVLVTDDGRVLLRYKNGDPRITGGRINETDENLEAALKREIAEEISCERWGSWETIPKRFLFFFVKIDNVF